MHTVYVVQVIRPGRLIAGLVHLDSAWPTQEAALERAAIAARYHNVPEEQVTVEHVPFEDSWA